jgi:hypothetical protein
MPKRDDTAYGSRRSPGRLVEGTSDAAFAVLSVTQVYDMRPTLDVWEKTCVPSSFKEFPLSRFREGANKAATVFHKEQIEKLLEKITYGSRDH